jgi:hypothetical protein
MFKGKECLEGGQFLLNTHRNQLYRSNNSIQHATRDI